MEKRKAEMKSEFWGLTSILRVYCRVCQNDADEEQGVGWKLCSLRELPGRQRTCQQATCWVCPLPGQSYPSSCGQYQVRDQYRSLGAASNEASEGEDGP